MSKLLEQSNKAPTELCLDNIEIISENTFNKGWGKSYEIFEDVETLQSIKYLSFKSGGLTSMHYFPDAYKTFKVLSGKFILEYPNALNTNIMDIECEVGDKFTIEFAQAYRIVCIEEGIIQEFSNGDETSIQRVFAGDTQKLEGEV